MLQHPYRAVVRTPPLRRWLPGAAVSALGDGMTLVAVSWLALDLAPPGRGGAWVAICSVSAVLPGLVVALVATRRLGRVPAVRLGAASALLQAGALGAVPLAATLGLLDVRVLAGLLGVGSLLRPWGSAGQYTLLAEVLDEEHRVAGNALVSTLAELGTLVGPALAALVIGLVGPVVAIGLDAASFLALAGAYRATGRILALPAAARAPARGPEDAPDDTSAGGGAVAVLRQPAVAAVLGLTVVFFALYGPVEVALPVHVREEFGAPVWLLSGYVVAFGLGALLGGVAAGWAGRLPLWPLTTAIVVGWGVCLLPMGLGAPVPLSLAAFAVGAFVYAPYLAVTTALVQRLAPRPLLPQVLAVRSAVLGFAVPVGAAASAPLLATVGARRTVLVAAVCTIALGAVAAGLGAAVSRRRA